VVYCSAGKDRTGLLVALLHTMLGVHPDDVMHDYLLTNTVSNNERRIEALRNEVAKRFGSLSDDAIRVVLSVEPSYLAAAFDEIRERSGTFENYLEYGLGITPELREAIAAKLIS
jgi:protein tyrosine/serine phosphatase